MTLKQYIDKCNERNGQQQNEDFWFRKLQDKECDIFVRNGRTVDANQDLAENFHGLTRNKCRALIMPYAVKNNVRVPPSWH